MCKMFVLSLFLMLSSLDVIFGQNIPGRLLGYSADTMIYVPRSELSSYEMTLSKCLDVCGLLFKQPAVAAIKGDFCMCGDVTNIQNTFLTCEPLMNCRANVSETCGCESAFAYYATDYKGQCELTVTTGTEVHATTTSKITIQLYGDYECAEGLMSMNKPGRFGPITSNCRELGRIERLRLGMVNPADAWHLISATVYVPEHSPHNFSFQFDNWLGQETFLGMTYGENLSAVDLFPNATFIYPEIHGGTFFKNFSTLMSPVPFICSINTDCQTKPTYVKFERNFYTKTVILQNLLYRLRRGCLMPSYVPPDVSTNLPSNRKETDPGFTATFKCLDNGTFLNTNTAEYTSRCSDYGVWSEDIYLKCTRNCLENLPNANPGVTSNATQNMINNAQTPGTVVSYVCETGMVFQGTQLNNVTVRCKTNGSWSAKNLPPCVNDTSSKPRFMQVSKLHPFFESG